MPALADHHSSRTTKIIVMGDPGTGKTGALASLAHAGYNLRVLDLDNGLDVLADVLMNPKSPYDKEAFKRVHYVTITERHSKLSARGGMEVPSSATVWNRVISTLQNWPDGLGNISTWTEKDVLVIDSLTLAGIAAYNFAAISTAGDKNVTTWTLYGYAQNYLEYLMQCLYAEDIKCNVIVNAHINFVGDENKISHGYPTTIGSKLSPKIGRYVNSILQMKSEGKQKRIYTTPVSTRAELKSSAPFRVKEWYDIKFGLAEYFKDVQASRPPETANIISMRGA